MSNSVPTGRSVSILNVRDIAGDNYDPAGPIPFLIWMNDFESAIELDELCKGVQWCDYMKHLLVAQHLAGLAKSWYAHTWRGVPKAEKTFGALRHQLHAAFGRRRESILTDMIKRCKQPGESWTEFAAALYHMADGMDFGQAHFLARFVTGIDMVSATFVDRAGVTSMLAAVRLLESMVGDGRDEVASDPEVGAAHDVLATRLRTVLEEMIHKNGGSGGRGPKRRRRGP